MCLLLETIRVEDGVPRNLAYHQRRVDRSRLALFGPAGPLDLSSLPMKQDLQPGVVKWRVVYGREVMDQTFEPYRPKPVGALQMVRAETMDYRFKYADRSQIDALMSRKGVADDILIVINGLVKDTSYANIAFFDGRMWFTPADPLLKGTCRERLLGSGLLIEKVIRETDVGNFITASLINAMLDLGEVVIPAQDIIPAI